MWLIFGPKENRAGTCIINQFSVVHVGVDPLASQVHNSFLNLTDECRRKGEEVLLYHRTSIAIDFEENV